MNCRGKFEPPSKKVQIDVRLDEVVLRALEKKPELRYQQASELKTEVETIAMTPLGDSQRLPRQSGAAAGVEAQTQSGKGTLVVIATTALLVTLLVVAAISVLVVAPAKRARMEAQVERDAVQAQMLEAAKKRELPADLKLPQEPSAKGTMGNAAIPGPAIQQSPVHATKAYTADARATQGGEGFLQQELVLANAGDYWAKFGLWDALTHGTHDVATNGAEADKWLADLVKGAYLATFEPANGFNPKTPEEMLDHFSTQCRLFSDKNGLGGASVFRTTPHDGKLIGSFLTELPDQFKTAIEKSSEFKLISIERVTPEMFVTHEASPQESLPELNASSDSETTRLAQQPPVVVETYPVSGARDVAPGEVEIRVRFSKPMSDGSWSWSTAWENSTPEPVGKPHYLQDHCTCVCKFGWSRAKRTAGG